MRFESHADAMLTASAEAAFDAAVDDVVMLAKLNARRHSRTGKFEGSITRTATERTGGGRLAARVGSPLVSARAKEQGAFIRPQPGRPLTFRTRDGVRRIAFPDGVRFAAQPAVVPAGQRFPEIMLARLRAQGLSGGSASAHADGFVPRPDFRSGRAKG